MVTSLIVALIMAVAVSAMILSSSLFIPVYAQAGGAQEESEGDLTVVINGETFTTGQTITISGSVDEPGTSPPHIQIFDPVGTVIAQAFPNLSADNTFTFSLVAGDNDDPILLAEGPMDTSGNYRVSVTFFPSFTNIDEVNMEFEYIVTPVPEEQEPPPAPPVPATPPAPATPPPAPAPATPTPSSSLNVTALRDMVAEGLESVQGLTFKLARANATSDIIGDLEAIQNTFQNIQRNLTATTATTATTTSQLQQPPQQQEGQQPSQSSQSIQPVL